LERSSYECELKTDDYVHHNACLIFDESGEHFCKERQIDARSLSGLGSRSENSTGRGQILSILLGNSCSIDQKNGGIWTGQMDLQQICPKPDRLLGSRKPEEAVAPIQTCIGSQAGVRVSFQKTVKSVKSLTIFPFGKTGCRLLKKLPLGR